MILSTVKSLNLLVRFALELCLLTAIGLACWRTISNSPMRIAATVGAPLLVATIWATIVHGSAIPSSVQLATQVALFAAAYVALCAIRRFDLAATFASAVVVNALLMVAWGQ